MDNSKLIKEIIESSRSVESAQELLLKFLDAALYDDIDSELKEALGKIRVEFISKFSDFVMSYYIPRYNEKFSTEELEELLKRNTDDLGSKVISFAKSVNAGFEKESQDWMDVLIKKHLTPLTEQAEQEIKELYKK